MAATYIVLHPGILPTRAPKGEGFADPLSGTLKTASNASDVKHLQWVYFHGKGLEAEAIAELVQYSVWHVKLVRTQYFKGGAKSLLANRLFDSTNTVESQPINAVNFYEENTK